MRLKALVVGIALLVTHAKIHQIRQCYVQMEHLVQGEGVNVKYVQEGTGEAELLLIKHTCIHT